MSAVYRNGVSLLVQPAIFTNGIQDGCHDEFERCPDAADRAVAQPAADEHAPRTGEIFGRVQFSVLRGRHEVRKAGKDRSRHIRVRARRYFVRLAPSRPTDRCATVAAPFGVPSISSPLTRRSRVVYDVC